MTTIRVDCYAGYRGEETPRRFYLGDQAVDVLGVLDRWLSPEHRYLKCRGADDATYISRQDVSADRRELILYERGHESRPATRMSGNRSVHQVTPVLWLTGAPGVGKTTVIQRVAEALPNQSLGGFYTEEIRHGGVRQGFRLEGFRGGSAVMAHVEFPKRYRVGRYGVDVGAIDELSSTALSREPPADIYLVDEVGKMECMSTRFIHALRALLDGPCTIVATIARSGGGSIADLKRWPESTLWEVTRDNRGEMPARVLAWLRCKD